MTGIQQQDPQDYQSLLAQQLMQAGPQEQIYSPMQGIGELVSALMGAYLMKHNKQQSPSTTVPLPMSSPHGMFGGNIYIPPTQE